MDKFGSAPSLLIFLEGNFSRNKDVILWRSRAWGMDYDFIASIEIKLAISEI